MNDLEPWKIWSVTAVLVCAILGSTATRLQPVSVGPVGAQAGTLTADERSASAPTTPPDATEDQYTAYSSYTPRRSSTCSGYFSSQPGAILPSSNLLYGSAAATAMPAEYDQQPVMDVAQQMLGDRDSQADLVAINNDQVMNYTFLSDVSTVDDLTSLGAANENGWTYKSMGDDLAFDSTDYPVNLLGNPIFFGGASAGWVDPSVLADSRVTNLALQNATINAAAIGSDLNGAVSLVQALGSGNGNAAQQLGEIDSFSVNPAQYLAFSGERQVDLGDEPEDVDAVQSQAVRAEAQALVVAEAQAQVQAALQQRNEAVFTVNGGTINVHISGVQFSVQPQE